MATELSALLKKNFNTAYKSSSPPNIEWVSTGLASLDYVLGQGFPLGRHIHIFGESSVSKSSLSLHLAGRFLKLGIPVIYLDLEKTVTEEYKSRYIDSAYEENFHYMQPAHGTEAVQIIHTVSKQIALNPYEIEALSGPRTNCLFVIDSVPHMVSEKSQEDGTANMTRALSISALLSLEMSRLNQTKSYGQSILYVNQLRSNITGYGVPRKPAGGSALPYLVDVSLELKKKEVAKDNLSMVVNASCRKNKVGVPFRTCDLTLHFNEKCFDTCSSLLDFLVQVNYLKSSGAWIKFVDEQEGEQLGFKGGTLANGLAKASLLLNSDLKIRQTLAAKAHEYIQSLKSERTEATPEDLLYQEED